MPSYLKPSQTVGPDLTPKRTFKNVSHEYIPGFNISKNIEDDILKYLGKCDWTAGYQYPVYVSSFEKPMVDLLEQRVRQHAVYNSTLRSRSTKMLSNAKKYKNSLKAAAEKNIHLLSTIRFAELLEQQPDLYFSGSYDWYFTGGNLQLLGNDYVAHVTGPNLNNIVISHTVDEDMEKHFKPIDDYVNNSYQIFELQKLETENMLSFSVRQKHSISTYIIQNEQLKMNFNIISEGVPFISSVCPLHNRGTLLTGDLENKIKLWDLNFTSQNPLRTMQIYENHGKDKNWNSLSALGSHMYAYSNIRSFTTLDLRMKENHHLYNFLGALEPCEQITCIKKSQFENLLYFGTTHKLFTVDIRFLNATINDNGIAQKWTHQLESCPLMINTSVRNDAEIETIALSSCLHGDIILIENTKKHADENSKEVNISYNVPYKPSNTAESLDYVKAQQFCLDISTNLKSRIQYHRCGMEILNKNNHISILYATSCGDIFLQNLLQENEVESFNEIIPINWDHMERQILASTNENSLNLTAISNLKGLNKILRWNRLNENILDERKEIIDEPIRPKRRTRWQRSFNQLQQYNDVLAKDLLSIWDIDEEIHNDNGNNTNLIDDNTTISQTGNPVDDWLHKNLEEIARINAPTNNLCDNLNSKDEIEQPEDEKTINEFELPSFAEHDETFDSIRKLEPLKKTTVTSEKRKERQKKKFNMGF